MTRTPEEIDADIAEAEAELARLAKLPPYFAVHGQVIDNRAKIESLNQRLVSLHSERSGTNPLQGPWLEA
jgi:hypothetical protein